LHDNTDGTFTVDDFDSPEEVTFTIGYADKAFEQTLTFAPRPKIKKIVIVCSDECIE